MFVQGTSTNTTMKRLTFNTKLAYWTGQLAWGLMTTSFGLFLLFYYNQVLGVSGTLCGIALFVATAVDAITDPLMGSVSDGWRSRLGRRHPFMYGSAVPMGVFFFLVFSPLAQSEIGLFAWLLIFSVLTRLAMTLYSVPHMALGAELTNDYRERTAVVAGRLAFDIVGMLIVYGLGLGFFFSASEAFPNGQLNAAAYPAFAGSVAVLMVLSILGTAWGTHQIIPELSQPNVEQGRGVKQTMRNLVGATRNVSFRWLSLGWVIVATPVGVGISLALYLNTFFWQIAPERMVPILVMYPLAMGLGFMLAPLASRYIEKRQALVWGAIGWAMFSIAPVCLHYAGLFPAPGTTGVVVGLGTCGFLAGLVVSQMPVAVASMLADVADQHELESGNRQEGVFYGAYAFVTKASGGIGAAFTGVALDLIQWPVGENVKTAADIPAEALFKLAMIGGPALALGTLPGVWCFNHYTLNRQRHAAVLTALEKRQTSMPKIEEPE